MSSNVYLLVSVSPARPRSGVAVTLYAEGTGGAARERELDALVETSSVREMYGLGIAAGLEALKRPAEVHVLLEYDVAPDFMHGMRGVSAGGGSSAPVRTPSSAFETCGSG